MQKLFTLTMGSMLMDVFGFFTSGSSIVVNCAPEGSGQAPSNVTLSPQVSQGFLAGVQGTMQAEWDAMQQPH